MEATQTRNNIDWARDAIEQYRKAMAETEAEERAANLKQAAEIREMVFKQFLLVATPDVDTVRFSTGGVRPAAVVDDIYFVMSSDSYDRDALAIARKCDDCGQWEVSRSVAGWLQVGEALDAPLTPYGSPFYHTCRGKGTPPPGENAPVRILSDYHMARLEPQIADLMAQGYKPLFMSATGTGDENTYNFVYVMMVRGTDCEAQP